MLSCCTAPSLAGCLILSILLPLCCRNFLRSSRDTNSLSYILWPIVNVDSVLGSFLRMSSAKRSSVARSQNHGDGRDEDPPDQPLMAEFLLASERNKRDTNRLLAQI